MSLDRLPPLTALRAFEAAARHLSFARAAAELNVTPAALSFQIKSLEEHFGHPLFRRLNRAVELTEAGRALAPGAAEGFSILSDAWRTARRTVDTSRLTVTAGPAFTAKWLAPRLFGFAQRNPDIELRFSASLKILDLARDEIDVAVRFGYSNDDGLYSEPLLEEWLIPMMTPELAARVTCPEDMADLTLLHPTDTAFLDPPADWATWFHAAGVEVDSTHGPRFSQADHALDAALSGSGVVLGRISIAGGDLLSGRLVAPFAPAISTRARYRAVCLPGSETRPQVRAFLDWLRDEAAAVQARYPEIRKVAVEDL